MTDGPGPDGAVDDPGSGLAGRRAVVTGAAGTIGGEICRRLVGAGVDVVALDVRPADVDGVSPLVADVSDREALEAALVDVRADLLVNCHGVNVRRDALSAQEEDFTSIFGVNVAGAWRTCQLLGPRMTGAGGAIVNITSVNATVAARTGALYGASKASLNHLTRILALELAPSVRVNAVAPTALRSAMTEDIFQDPAYVEQKRKDIPLGRVAEPADVADATLFLLSDRSRMITGHILTVDGGISLG